MTETYQKRVRLLAKAMRSLVQGYIPQNLKLWVTRGDPTKLFRNKMKEYLSSACRIFALLLAEILLEIIHSFR